MEEENELKDKVMLIVVTIILFAITFACEKGLELPSNVMFFAYLCIYLVIGGGVIKEAFENLTHGEVFDENFLMTIATLGALLIGFLPNSEPMYHEAVFVMLFYNIGELFEIIAEGKTTTVLKSIMNIRPDVAYLYNENGRDKISPEEVKIGDVLDILPGEKIPLDGSVVYGESSINTTLLTGESVPRGVKVGDEVYSGTINVSGNIRIKTTKTFENSTANKIIDLIKNAQDGKSKSEKFITKFSKIYTPIVVILAILIAIILPIIDVNLYNTTNPNFGSFLNNFMMFFPTWLVRALTFLIVSCPCALVISIPLSFFGAIGGASKRGVLVKGSTYLETLSKVNTIVFDKTGTLTEGVFDVTVVHPNEISQDELLHMACHVESYSNHPIAISLKNAYKHDDDCVISDVEELSGMGIVAKVNDSLVGVGNIKLMQKYNIEVNDCEHPGTTVVHVFRDKEYLGHIVISDKIKDSSLNAINSLKENRINSIIVSGDKDDVVKNVADTLGIEKYYSEMTPEGKIKAVEEIMNNNSKEKKVAFIGDGLNDTPVLTKADLGISLGGIGSDSAIESADVVLMDDDLNKIMEVIKIAKKTIRISKQNIVLAIVIKIAVLILASLGLAPMWLAVFADVGVTVIAVLNAMRNLI